VNLRALLLSIVLPNTNDITEIQNAIVANQTATTTSIAASGVVAIPTATILEYAGPATTSSGAAITAPTGFLWCDGSTYAPGKYPALFKIIGYTYGQSQANFKVPDRREVAGVGVGTSSNSALNASTSEHDVFTLGQVKDDQFESHYHAATIQAAWQGSGSNFGTSAGGLYPSVTVTAPTTDGTNALRTGSVTRGKRIGMNYIIKT
jgi:microcystin-dependent protein